MPIYTVAYAALFYDSAKKLDQQRCELLRSLFKRI